MNKAKTTWIEYEKKIENSNNQKCKMNSVLFHEK
jgi:hypothetical protein